MTVYDAVDSWKPLKPCSVWLCFELGIHTVVLPVEDCFYCVRHCTIPSR